MKLGDQLDAAFARRAALVARADTGCYRLLNAAGDALPDVTLDRFADVGVLSLYADVTPAREAELADGLCARLGLHALYLKRRPREARTVSRASPALHAPEQPLRGEQVPQLTVRENGLELVIRPAQGLAVGLYLDMRPTRAWLREHVRGATVLNAFAYTCAFGVYATAGGAARVLNIDLSRKSLDWGCENARANGQPVNARDYLAGDVFDWLGRMGRRQERFDVVVLDPPSFAKSNKGKREVFSAASDYPSLVTLAAPTVAPGGTLLAACNLARLTAEGFANQVRSGLEAAGRRAVSLTPLSSDPTDFPSPPGEPPALKVMACRLD